MWEREGGDGTTIKEEDHVFFMSMKLNPPPAPLLSVS